MWRERGYRISDEMLSKPNTATAVRALESSMFLTMAKQLDDVLNGDATAMRALDDPGRIGTEPAISGGWPLPRRP
jgi:hypothetical protein